MQGPGRFVVSLMRARALFKTKSVFVLVAVVLFVPILWTVFIGGSDLATLELYQRKIVELTDQLQYSDAVNKACQDDVINLRGQINLLTSVGSNRSLFELNNTAQLSYNQSAMAELWQVAQKRNTSTFSDAIFVASIYTYLPHLVEHPRGLSPKFKLSRRRTGVSLVIGVPTIKRQKENYLLRTIQSLIESMSEAERAMCLIVVMISEPEDYQFVLNMSSEIANSFPQAIDSGLLEVISSPPEFYPDFSLLKSTFGDTLERVKWRTKQNLDYSFLMLYASTRGQYYVQVEDDVVTKPGYVSVMKAFTQNQKGGEWVLLEFCTLGFIGKLFKTAELQRLVEFFLMFYREKPVDWLLDHYLYVKVCSPEKDQKTCRKNILEVRKRYKPSLFQHIGVYSSLTGKVQKLKDRDFGKQPRFRSHVNPLAMVATNMSIYQRFSLERAYMGESFFWVTNPKRLDYFQFVFSAPTPVSSFSVRSGDVDHPMDLIPDARLDVQFEVMPTDLREQALPDDFVTVAKFDHGQCTGTIDEKYGNVQSMRVVLLTDSTNWALITEITIKTRR